MSDYFLFLEAYDDAGIAAVLMQEGPQTIAVVLGCITPDKAARILRLLPQPVAAEVSRKLATADKVDETTIAAIERAIRRKFMQIIK